MRCACGTRPRRHRAPHDNIARLFFQPQRSKHSTRRHSMTLKKTLLALTLSALSGLALADVNVGVTVSATGPAASLGIPEKNTIALMPTTIGGQKINYIV